ncbi:Apolipoprotein L5 [Triplophysa tibetana]|uniref:Apolipoprotein L5 n=1 Tax=Triplophysa tibetana TaxID=1572043 RepID=A0A5A9N907_9TELE|nr:Apolipoprotein L5 [Triplophysa tibetana]
MRDIKDEADKIILKFDHVKKSKNKGKAFGQYLKSGLTQVTADSRRKKLEKSLSAVLKDTFEGLEKLEHFLDAVEKLAVTSMFAFTHFTASFLPKGDSPESVRSVIKAAKMASPLLIHFKRNDETFFLPILNNVDVLAFQLDKYIQITQLICERMNKRWIKDDPLQYSLNVKSSKKKKLNHLSQLKKIRMDQNARLMFLFQEHALNFIGFFGQHHSEMEKFLSDLEESAVQLDRMKFGGNISTVAGSSVGVAGGVLSIVGLALAPVTAGVSLVLTLTGVGLGVTSGVNSLVTGITETAVNYHHDKNSQSIFQRYMKYVEKIQGHLEKASVERIQIPDMIRAGRLILHARIVIKDNDALVEKGNHLVVKVQKRKGTLSAKLPKVVKMVIGGKTAAPLVSVAKGIDGLVDAASAVKVLQSEEVIATATKMGLQEAQSARSIPKLAADLPDIGQLAKGTPLALSKSARAGFITANALFIGLDVFFICKDSISLAKGSKSEKAQLIRSRAALWKSELEAWKKIYDSLCIGKLTFGSSQKLLEQPLFP